MGRKITVRDIRQMKEAGEKIPMITAYDYTTAYQADQAGIPLLLVGDSLGMVVLGYDSTIPVTIEDMVHHTKAVVRGANRALVVSDLPFMSYQASEETALHNAARLVQEGGAHSVKLEGGERIAATVDRIVGCGIPVMGHLGLTPQSIHGLSGYHAQGRVTQEAAQMIRDAHALEDAGAYAVVLELVPTSLAGVISSKLSIPTIGIGAGPLCDGQVQVVHDMLGLYTQFMPKHAKRYAHLGDEMTAAFRSYSDEVKEGIFPTEKESVQMDAEVLRSVTDALPSC
jgi:3-methyl-2-oxobutanoate hydroxymethyltransferase